MKLLVFYTLTLAGLFLLALAGYAYSQRRRSDIYTVYAFMGLMATSAWYAMSYAFELSLDDASLATNALKVEYIGLVFIPAMCIITGLRFTGHERYVTKRLIAVLFLLSVTFLSIVLTNDYHHLYYASVNIVIGKEVNWSQLTKAPFYWAFIAYLQFSFVYSLYLITKKVIQAKKREKKKYFAVLVAVVIPILGHVAYLSGLTPFALDFSSFAMIGTGACMTYALTRTGLLYLSYAAREKVFASLRDEVLVLDDENRLIDFNEAAVNLDKRICRKYYHADISFLSDKLQRVVDFCKENQFGELEVVLQKNALSKKYYSVSVSPVMEGDELIGKVIVFRETTHLSRMVETLHYIVDHDGLTNLLSRKGFADGVHKCVKTMPYGEKVALVMFDLDNFKQINDEHGHFAGDAVLKRIGDVLYKMNLPQSLVGRYGGEEFMVFFSDLREEQVVSYTEKIRHTLEKEMIRVERMTISVTGSFGIAFGCRTREFSLEAMIKLADKALYLSKNKGKNRMETLYLEKQ